MNEKKNVNCNSRKSESNELCSTKKNIDEMQSEKKERRAANLPNANA